MAAGRTDAVVAFEQAPPAILDRITGVSGAQTSVPAVLYLQRRIGNKAVGDLLRRRTTLSRQTPTGAAAAGASAGPVPTAADIQEFSDLTGKGATPVGKAGLTSKKKLDKITTVADYVAYRNTFFGSAAAYAAAKSVADGEFDAKGFPRHLIGQTESKAFKRALYPWVRQAMVNEGVADPVRSLKSGVTPALKSQLAAVQKAIPGLATKLLIVARPQKQGGYRLGTISEHGLGKAVDLTPQSNNPHLDGPEWAFLLSYTGKSPNVTKSRWMKDPAGVWQDMKDLNDAFVTALENDLKAGKSLSATLKGKPKLRGAVETAAADPTDVTHGFFDLDKATVLEFQKQGFIWGVTFPTKDLHHFEIP